jgi:hypothetical protein
MAHEVVAAMPLAIATVEERLHGRFRIPIQVYVCATITSFASYGANPRAAGLTTNHRVFLSPKPEDTPERVPRVLAHELTHLHLSQGRTFLLSPKVPAWFDEGLAVDVSGGAGAEGVTEEEARAAMAQGRMFVPRDGSLWRRDGARSFGLDEHLFYRQAQMFVASLRRRDEQSFVALLADVEGGRGMEESVRRAYGQDLGELWVDGPHPAIKRGVCARLRGRRRTGAFVSWATTGRAAERLAHE